MAGFMGFNVDKGDLNMVGSVGKGTMKAVKGVGGVVKDLAELFGADTKIGGPVPAPPGDKWTWVQSEVLKRMQKARTAKVPVAPGPQCIAVLKESPEALAYAQQLLKTYSKKRDPRNHSVIHAITSDTKKAASKAAKKWLKSEPGKRFLWLREVLGLEYSYRHNWAASEDNIGVNRYRSHAYADAAKRCTLPESKALYDIGVPMGGAYKDIAKVAPGVIAAIGKVGGPKFVNVPLAPQSPPVTRAAGLTISPLALVGLAAVVILLWKKG